MNRCVTKVAVVDRCEWSQSCQPCRHLTIFTVAVTHKYLRYIEMRHTYCIYIYWMYVVLGRGYKKSDIDIFAEKHFNPSNVVTKNDMFGLQ